MGCDEGRSKNMKFRTWIALAVLAVALSVFANAQFSGAIYTTKSDGQTVNANLYDNKADVYLNGGPQNPQGSGLPDGVYYFQVTSPDGVLLSTDDAECRQVVVSKGRMAGAYTGGSISCAHPNATANDNNGSLGVQLIPYDDTPNPGGEYKVWLISQAPGCVSSVIGAVITFSNSCAKTDNFKVKGGTVQTIGISGVKYRDANRNGTRQEGEDGLSGWTIHLYINGQLAQSDVTDSDGKYFFSLPQNTQNVKICEELQTNWVQYGPIPGTTVPPFTADSQKCWAADNAGSQDVTGLDFGNYNKVRLKGVKFYDTNNDGTKQTDEPGLVGWTIQLNDGAASKTTGPGGGYEFEVEIGSTYKLCEVLQAGYSQSSTPTCYTGTVPSTDVENLNFGNNIRASGRKFLDANQNGTNDSEPGIPGFKIEIAWCQDASCSNSAPYPQVVQTVYTDPNGDWSTVLPPPPTVPAQTTWWFRVCEVLPPSSPVGSWTQTAPASACYIVQVGGAGTPGPNTGLDFGNYCRPTFGRTLGFWSNKNGQKVFEGLTGPTALDGLKSLNLRDGAGADFDPPSYTDFRSWILSATATNMAYMLSAQMAATYLSARAANAGGVQVWFMGNWITVDNAISNANYLLSDAGCDPLTDGKCVVLSDHPKRSSMAAYKDLFDAINNNLAVTQGCPVVYPQ
jgi:hypothetical protein